MFLPYPIPRYLFNWLVKPAPKPEKVVKHKATPATIDNPDEIKLTVFLSNPIASIVFDARPKAPKTINLTPKTFPTGIKQQAIPTVNVKPLKAHCHHLGKCPSGSTYKIGLFKQ